MKKIMLTILIIAVFMSGCTAQPEQPPVTTTTTTQTIATTTTTAQTTATTTPTTTATITVAAIKIKDYSFIPTPITVKTGTTVTWTNEDSTDHTVASDSGTEINSPSLSQGQSYSHTFNTAGTYTYHCGVHPIMKATIIVE
jgi:amicyanin